MDIEEDIPLSTLTTFRTGGPARFLISAHEEGDIARALAFARNKGVPLIPLGNGSNLCAPDEGISAAFVRFLPDGVSITRSAEGIFITAEAGLLWDTLVLRATTEGWWGIENLSGIPGTVGASVVQNIGAYGAAIGEHVVSVDVFDTKEGILKTFSKGECLFGYRTSIFKKEVDRYVVLRITLALSEKAHPNLSYRDLKSRLGEMSHPTLSDIRAAVIEIRKGKFPSLSTYGTAGSFFLNPLITNTESAALAARYPEMPLFPLPEGGSKIPLAWIFDHVLSLKGMREGGAFVWEQQPLVLVAEFGAQSRDVYALAGKIVQMTKEKTGILLTPEVRLFGAEKKFFSHK